MLQTNNAEYLSAIVAPKRTALHSQNKLHGKTLPQKPKNRNPQKKNHPQTSKKALQTFSQIILNKLPLKK